MQLCTCAIGKQLSAKPHLVGAYFIDDIGKMWIWVVMKEKQWRHQPLRNWESSLIPVSEIINCVLLGVEVHLPIELALWYSVISLELNDSVNSFCHDDIFLG